MTAKTIIQYAQQIAVAVSAGAGVIEAATSVPDLVHVIAGAAVLIATAIKTAIAATELNENA